ncbi:spore cortex-lytic enzyme [Oscillospiraceae bacterium WX1]
MANKRKLILSLAVIFALNIALISLIQFLQSAQAATYRRGSTGSVVTEIQQRLSDWGYYDNGIDGVYGEQTESAVRYFQSKNGLTVDGVAGDETLAAIGVNGGSGTTARSNDMELLARLISAEARGEPYTGQVAVGAVVLNRTKHPAFPHSISGVVYQPGAFTCLDDGQFYAPVSDSAYNAARDALNGWDPSGGAIYYFNPNTATSAWIWSRPLLVIIGDHRFCS